MSSDDDIFDFGSSAPAEDDLAPTESKPTGRFGRSIRRGDGSVPVPYIASLINFTFEMTAKMMRSQNLNTNARAVYDIVNEGMEGHVDIRVKLYEMEATLVVLHSQKRFVNVVNESLEKIGREASESMSRFAMFIDCWVDYVDFSIKTNAERYKTYAEYHELKYHQSLMDRGVYPYVSPSLAIMAGDPPGDLHYKHGDVSALPSKSAALVSIWVTYGLQLIQEKDSKAFEDIFT